MIYRVLITDIVTFLVVFAFVLLGFSQAYLFVLIGARADPTSGTFCHMKIYDGVGATMYAFMLTARQSPSSLKVRFLPVSQYLLELASGVWLLECGVLSSREA